MRTLVIKLAGIVEDNDLLKLGELRLSITPVDGQSTQKFQISSAEPVTLEITGDGTFTENGAKKLELDAVTNKWIEFTNGTFRLSLMNKEALTKLNFFEDYNHIVRSGLDLSQLRTMKQLEYLDTERGYLTGDISALAGMSKLKLLKLFNTLTGDISLIGTNMPLLEHFQTINCPLTGSTATFNNLTKLQQLHLYRCRVTSKLADFGRCTALKQINLLWSSSGDIEALAGLTNLERLAIESTPAVTGDTSSLAHLHPNNGGKLATFLYSGSGITGTWPPSA